jgi:hypothetical protein
MGMDKPTVCHYAEDVYLSYIKRKEKHEVGKDHENQIMEQEKRKTNITLW